MAGHDVHARPVTTGTGPGIGRTVVITLLFSVLGAIPAYLDAQKAQRAGRPGDRYWAAFGVSLAVSLAAYALVVGLTLGVLSSHASARGTATAAGATAYDGPTVSCTYLPADSRNPDLVDVGTPPTPRATPVAGTTTLLMATDQGDLKLTLDRASAPCAAASFSYLASRKFFDGSPCHREANDPTFGFLQCGDPTGTGAGGPTYTFAEEVPAGTTYPRGTIAMANTGRPNSTGSQFFLCFVDTELSPDYTPVGTVDKAGLAALDRIAAAGNDGSFGASAGGGAPNRPVTITRMTVVR